MTKIKCFFSIVIPVYKTEEFLDECLSSIQTQDFKNFEVIVVNDGSPYNDLFEEIKKQYNQDKRFIFLNQKNQGVSVARNHGLSEATGSYVLFLDSDDYYEPNFLTTLAKQIGRGSSNIIYALTCFKELRNSTIRTARVEQIPKKLNWNTQLVFFSLPMHTIILNRKIAQSTTFKKDFQHGEEPLYLFNIYLKNKNLRFKEIQLKNSVVYRIRENSSSRQNTLAKEKSNYIQIYKFILRKDFDIVKKILAVLGILRYRLYGSRISFFAKPVTFISKCMSGWFY